MATLSVEADISTSDGLAPGDRVELDRLVEQLDVNCFATTTGDRNPLHTDEEAAEDSRFGGRIVHGALLEGVISATLAKFPGTVVWLSQETTFSAPVFPDQVITAEATVVEALGDNRYEVETTLVDEEGTVCVEGEATILVEGE